MDTSPAAETQESMWISSLGLEDDWTGQELFEKVVSEPSAKQRGGLDRANNLDRGCEGARKPMGASCWQRGQTRTWDPGEGPVETES